MGRSGSAIEPGAGDAVNPPGMCGSLQLSRCLEAIQSRFRSGKGQDCDSTSLPKAGERESIISDMLGGTCGAQALQCTHGCKETPGLFLPGLDLQPPSPGGSHMFSAGRDGLELPGLEQ